MHDCPREKGCDAAHLDLTALQYGKSLADYGHVAFIDFLPAGDLVTEFEDVSISTKHGKVKLH